MMFGRKPKLGALQTSVRRYFSPQKTCKKVGIAPEKRIFAIWI